MERDPLCDDDAKEKERKHKQETDEAKQLVRPFTHHVPFARA